MKHGATFLIAALALAGVVPTWGQSERVGIRYVHNLSSFSGPVETDYVAMHADLVHDELFISEGDRIRVFNANGMEVFQFVHDIDRGPIADFVVNPDGDFMLLTCGSTGARPCAIERCDFRGDRIETLEIAGLPVEIEAFHPTRIEILGDRLYLLDRGRMFAVVTDDRGNVQESYDLANILRLPGIAGDGESSSPEIFGFDVASDGTMLFTVPVWFKAFLVSPDGSARAFGRAGSSRGLFGVISGIGRDSDGRILITDRLHGVVMVFSPTFEFLGDFGGTVGKPDSLLRPGDLEVANNGRVFVTQLGKRGVAAFDVTARGRN